MKNQYNVREFKAIGIVLIIFVPIGLYMTHNNYLDSDLKNSLLILFTDFLFFDMGSHRQ